MQSWASDFEWSYRKYNKSDKIEQSDDMNAPHLKHVEYCYLWSKCCVQLRLKSDGEELIVAKLILLDSSRASRLGCLD